jgi:hypothetical protein
MCNPIAVTGEERRLLSCLLQFRPIEVTALEKWQWDLENARLAGFEFKLLATLRCGANRQGLLFAERELVLGADDNPDSALRAGDAWAHNAIGHTKSIRPSASFAGFKAVRRFFVVRAAGNVMDRRSSFFHKTKPVRSSVVS